MGFVTPTPSSFTYDTYLGTVRMSDYTAPLGSLTNKISSSNPVYFLDSNSVTWVGWLDTTGAWYTEVYPTTVGSPMGLLLSLTYSS